MDNNKKKGSDESNSDYDSGREEMRIHQEGTNESDSETADMGRVNIGSSGVQGTGTGQFTGTGSGNTGRENNDEEQTGGIDPKEAGEGADQDTGNDNETSQKVGNSGERSGINKESSQRSE
jgi:hypothetical protein